MFQVNMNVFEKKIFVKIFEIFEVLYSHDMDTNFNPSLPVMIWTAEIHTTLQFFTSFRQRVFPLIMPKVGTFKAQKISEK